MSNALHYLISTIGNLYICCYLLRFLLQLVRADFRNPLSQFIVSVTGPLVRPLRRVIPGISGIDLATLLIAVVLQALLTILLLWMTGLTLEPGALLVFALVSLLKNLIMIFLIAVLVRAILSWVSQGGYNPFTQILASLTDPLLRPVQRVLPPIGGLDLSPLVVLIALQALLIAIS